MKKLIKLRGEVIIIVILSIIIGWGISAIVINTYYRSNYGQMFIDNMAKSRNEEDIKYIKRTLNIESGNEDFIIKQIRNKENLNRTPSEYTIYLTDKDGNVIESTSDLKIDKIKIEKDNSFRIERNTSKFVGKNFFKLSSNRYVVLINTGYCKDDIYTVAICLVMIGIVFLILIKGRVKYINEIAIEVREIAKGDLSKRVNVKYSNELSDLARDINYMTEEIQNQDIKQKEFITNISHDLRTPLTTIMGYLKMIEEEKYIDKNELQKYIGIATKKGEYLKLLLEDFFSYSKLYSKDININSLEINLNNCIREMLLEEEVKFKNNNLKVDICTDKLITNGEPILIGRVFENIIGNAIKYSKSNSDISVSLTRERINNKIYGVFEISNVANEDISIEEVDRFFQRLYKKNSWRNEEGSGLGLAICQEIVKIHGGFINATKVKDKIKVKVGFLCD